MKPAQLTKRIEELSEKLKPVPTEGIRIDFKSFTEPEQLVILKNAQLDEEYGGKWKKELVLANKDIIVKCNSIVINRVIELFLFTMPRAMMLDEVDQILFRINFWGFVERWIECQKNTAKWTQKQREDFLQDMKITEEKTKGKDESNGEENNT
jgi:hypothetical protein